MVGENPLEEEEGVEGSGVGVGTLKELLPERVPSLFVGRVSYASSLSDVFFLFDEGSGFSFSIFLLERGTEHSLQMFGFPFTLINNSQILLALLSLWMSQRTV